MINLESQDLQNMLMELTRHANSGEHARAIFFVFAVLIFGLCMHRGCALVLILGSTCANVWAISAECA